MVSFFSLSCSEQVDFYLTNGKPKSIDDYRGTWLVINFWAEWCAPCRKEVPELNRLHENSGLLNVAIIGVSYDPLLENDIAKIAESWQIQYPLMKSDPIPILPFGLPQSLPGNYILDPTGKLVAKLKGEQTYESLTKLLISLKKEKS